MIALITVPPNCLTVIVIQYGINYEYIISYMYKYSCTPLCVCMREIGKEIMFSVPLAFALNVGQSTE